MLRSPARAYYPYQIQGQPTPAVRDLSDMDWQMLRQTVRNRVARFESDLHSIPNRDVWISRFGLPEISAIAKMDEQDPLSESERQSIGRLLANYDAATQDPGLRAITRLASFRQLRAALDELWKPAGQRMHEQLARSGEQLHDALSRLSTGRGWQEYLEMPTTVALRDDATAADRARFAELYLEKLTSLLGRFDSVSKNKDYRVIAQLPEFQTTYERLASCVAWVTNGPTGNTSVAPEELPPPRQ